MPTSPGAHPADPWAVQLPQLEDEQSEDEEEIRLAGVQPAVRCWQVPGREQEELQRIWTIPVSVGTCLTIFGINTNRNTSEGTSRTTLFLRTPSLAGTLLTLKVWLVELRSYVDIFGFRSPTRSTFVQAEPITADRCTQTDLTLEDLDHVFVV